MARPRKAEDQLHSIQLKLWLTEDQERQLLKISECRDVPKGIVAREALLLGLSRYLESLRQSKAA